MEIDPVFHLIFLTCLVHGSESQGAVVACYMEFLSTNVGSLLVQHFLKSILRNPRSVR